MSRCALALRLLSVIPLFLFAGAASQAATWYVKAGATGPTYDGKSWSSPFLNVQQAIDAALAGDQVYIAAGLYTERLTITKTLSLQGGYAGTGADPDLRDPVAFETILDGDGQGTVVTVLDADGVLSGVTIRNGLGSYQQQNGVYSGAAVSLTRSSMRVENNKFYNNRDWCTLSAKEGTPLIIRNHFSGNFASQDYGMLVSLSQCVSPRFTHNTIKNNNVNYSLVASVSPGAILANNLIQRNTTWMAFSVSSASVMVTNNTVVNNTGVTTLGSKGIWANDKVTVRNNIFAFNDVGIDGTIDVTYGNNVLFGNRIRNFFTPTPNPANNWEVDPGFVDMANGDLHLNSDSPCINAGNSAALDVSQDIDGEERIQSGYVDIGADETGFNVIPPTHRILFVSPAGNIENDGLAWSSALPDPAEAIAKARAGDEVWVAAGVYPGNVSVPAGVSMFGGFAGDETLRLQRNPETNVTILDGAHSLPVVIVDGAWVTIDGFTLRNGSGSSTASAGGITLNNGGSVTVARCRILQCDSSVGGGVRVATDYDDYPFQLLDCVLEENIASEGGAVYLTGPARLLRNRFVGNQASDDGTALLVRGGGKIACRNNLFTENRAANDTGWSRMGSCISVKSASGLAFGNNTVVKNVSANGPVMQFTGFGVVYNNLFAHNTAQVRFQSQSSTSGSPILSSNLFYGNGNAECQGYVDSTCVNGTSLVADPRFADAGIKDYRLSGQSPALGKGTVQYLTVGDTDLEGFPRTTGETVNIGAYETVVNATPIAWRLLDRLPACVIRIEHADPQAVIRYTMDGTDPNESSPQLGSAGDITVLETGVVKFRTYRSPYLPSRVGLIYATIERQLTDVSRALKLAGGLELAQSGDERLNVVSDSVIDMADCVNLVRQFVGLNP